MTAPKVADDSRVSIRTVPPRRECDAIMATAGVLQGEAVETAPASCAAAELRPSCGSRQDARCIEPLLSTTPSPVHKPAGQSCRGFCSAGLQAQGDSFAFAPALESPPSIADASADAFGAPRRALAIVTSCLAFGMGTVEQWNGDPGTAALGRNRRSNSHFPEIRVLVRESPSTSCQRAFETVEWSREVTRRSGA